VHLLKSRDTADGRSSQQRDIHTYMGRNKQKSKDRAYITATEWKTDYGGRSVYDDHAKRSLASSSRLPFNHCAITFKPIEPGRGDVAVVAPDGTVMSLESAVPYVSKFHSHPVTGAPLEMKDLTKIQFHTNPQNEVCCPVLGKVFNENSHIVAIKKTGNVYCGEAVEELNVKAKNMRDLLTDEAFTKKDILVLQDPKDLRGKTVKDFDHVKKHRLVAGEDGKAAPGSAGGVNAVGQDAERVLKLVRDPQKNEKDEKDKTSTILYRSEPARKRYELVSYKPGTSTWNTDANQHDKPDDTNATNGKTIPSPYSREYRQTNVTLGGASKSLTSTAVNLALSNEMTKELIYLRPKSKGYVRLHTNLGDVNIEIHCDLVPKTCENFMALAAHGYYDGCVFHRSIPNFMIQGGDPTGTGKGGTNIFGGEGMLEDEMHQSLKHDARGVVSMANSGKNTNGSQFFILYKSARHLDRKHSVFGKVVGGFDVLAKMEKVATDDKDVPAEEIRIERCTIFANPYEEMIQEEEKKKMEQEKKDRENQQAAGIERLDEIMMRGNEGRARVTGVGKYLKTTNPETLPPYHTKNTDAGGNGTQPPAKKKKTGPSRPMTNFDAW
jgi:peptidyl-prolyl cis-trans isomerase-like protein 2